MPLPDAAACRRMLLHAISCCTSSLLLLLLQLQPTPNQPTYQPAYQSTNQSTKLENLFSMCKHGRSCPSHDAPHPSSCCWCVAWWRAPIHALPLQTYQSTNLLPILLTNLPNCKSISHWLSAPNDNSSGFLVTKPTYLPTNQPIYQPAYQPSYQSTNQPTARCPVSLAHSLSNYSLLLHLLL